MGSSKPMKETLVNSSPKKLVLATGLVVAGLAIGAAGIYVGDIDDAPGAALLGIGLMVGLIVFGVRIARRKRRGFNQPGSYRRQQRERSFGK